MIRINLLPYRAKLRQRQILVHIFWFLGTVAAVVAVCIGVNISASMSLSAKLEEQKELAKQVAVLDKQLKEIAALNGKRDEVQNKLKIIDELQVGRFRSLNMLYEVSRVIPKNVWIKSLNDGRTEITMKGAAGTSEGIADFLRALDNSPYFQKDSARLGAVSRKREKNALVRSFDVRVSFAKLEDEKKAGGK